MHAPARATDATRNSIARAFHSNLLVCMVLSMESDLNAFCYGSVADPDLTPLPAGGGVNMPILKARAVAGVIAQAVIIVVIAGDDDEAIAEVVISIVISVVIPVVEATAHVGAMKVVHTTVAEVRVSMSSRTVANYAAAGRSAADMSSSESTATTDVAPSESATASKTAATHVSATKSTTNVAPSESAATSKAATTSVPRGERVRRHRGTERNGGKEDHRLARDRLLLEVLKDVHNISLSSSRLNVHVRELFTKA
jgi:hypothetical protein